MEITYGGLSLTRWKIEDFHSVKQEMEMCVSYMRERKEIFGGRKNLVWQIDRVDEKETWLVGPPQRVLNLLNYAR